MKTKQIFWGVFLISIGILILLRNYLNINLEWGDIWKLWPLVFVFIGINIMIKNEMVKSLLSIVTALLLAFAIYASVAGLFGLVKDDFRIHVDDDGEFEISEYSASGEGIIKAKLNVEAGAGSFIINDTTSQLFFASVEGKKNSYSLITKTSDSSALLDFKMNETRFFPGKVRNRVDLRLNPETEWDLNFDLGAAAIDFDLSAFNVSNLDIDMGATSLRLKLSSINRKSYVNIDAGASSIDIDVPEEAGVEIDADVSLSSKDFIGFSNKSDNIYRTENFDSSEKKIYISLHSGISSIKVNRNSW